jgi:hypothetical protein
MGLLLSDTVLIDPLLDDANGAIGATNTADREAPAEPRRRPPCGVGKDS